MPTLAELKAKWFIPMDGSTPDGVPCRRHAQSVGPIALAVSTDGNIVESIVDGQQYMTRWHASAAAIHGAAGAEFFHGAWRLEDVFTQGVTLGPPHALEDILAAHLSPVFTIPLLCRNLGTFRFNRTTLGWLRSRGVSKTCLDNRFPAPFGSNHQKFAVFKTAAAASAYLGSIDIAKTRWDTPAHLAVNRDRDPALGKQTHDTGAFVQGLAVGDIEKTFRERWNDSSRTFGLTPLLPSQPLITSPVAAFPAGGSHSVQVLRTYGITGALFGYSWFASGEFTVWASYLNAIKRATVYIYIEDQYFLPFDWPPCYARTGLAQATDIIFQLGEAIKRGVKVAILTPSNAEDSAHMYQKYQRDVGVNYLESVRAALPGGATGDVVVASMKTGATDVYIHSKLMIVDDEFVNVGSTNVGQRSMSFDSELHIGVVDDNDTFAKEFRKTLWNELTGQSPAALDDPVAAYGLFKTATATSAVHLKPYPVDPLAVYPAVAGSTPPPFGHRSAMQRIDPYAGPPGLR